MPNNINRASRGWLGFLRAKVGGQQPNGWLNDVRPIIDLRPFVANENLVSDQIASSISSTGQTITLHTVPADECWMLHSLCCHIFTNTAVNTSNYGARLLATLPDYTGGTVSSDLDGGQQVLVAGQTSMLSLRADLGVGFIFPPGSTVTVAVRNNSAETLTFASSMIVTPLQI